MLELACSKTWYTGHRASQEQGARNMKMPCCRRRFKCCIILCDLAWLDPDMKVSNGISATEQRDMLRLDALIMMVQMNIRKLITVRTHAHAGKDQ